MDDHSAAKAKPACDANAKVESGVTFTMLAETRARAHSVEIGIAIDALREGAPIQRFRPPVRHLLASPSFLHSSLHGCYEHIVF